ncbi:MAG: hypothetical protein RLY85_61, partial [Bacteroidota bacterium]
MLFQHEIVAVGFSQDTGSRDGSINTIAFDDGGVRNIPVRFETVSINHN